MICAPAAPRSPGVRALTVACGPTGMNWGVSISPWGVVRRPSRARPNPVARKLNVIGALIRGEDSPATRRETSPPLASTDTLTAVRLSDWPRMPFLNDEVKEWIGMELRSLGVEDLAVYATEAGAEGDERRVIVATEVGLLDHRYAPFGSSARYRLAMLLYPWQVLRGVELRADTFRLWAMEHRTRWSFKLHYPVFEASPDSPDLGQALCDLAGVCAVMAEPFGVPAARSAGHESTTAALEVGGRAHPRPAPGPTPTDDGSGAEAASPPPLDTVAGGNAPEAERMEAAAVAASTAGDEISTEGHAKPRGGAEPRARAEPRTGAEPRAGA